MARLKRNVFVPLVDVNLGSGTASWKPIDLSTIFELSWNPQEETYSYICYANDSTEVTSYQPELPQEIVLDNENPIYTFFKDLFMTFPVGSGLKVPVLIAMPDDDTGLPTDGWKWADAIASPGSLNSVDGKLSFTLKLNGDPVTGTVSGIGTGTVTFT